MMAEKATSSSTGRTMNQALLFKVLSISGPQLDAPGIGVEVDAPGIEGELRVRRDLLMLGYDRRDFAAFELGMDDLAPADILDLGHRDRQALAAEPHMLGPYAQLDGRALADCRAARQLDGGRPQMRRPSF